MNARGSRSGYVLCTVSGPGEGQAFPVAEVTTIGRDPTSWIVVADSLVSRQHAIVRWSANGLLVEDLDSGNGTRLNGTKIAEPTALSVGDEIGVGPTLFRLEAESASGARRRSPPPLPPPVREEEPPPVATLPPGAVPPILRPREGRKGALLVLLAVLLAFVGGLVALVLLP